MTTFSQQKSKLRAEHVLHGIIASNQSALDLLDQCKGNSKQVQTILNVMISNQGILNNILKEQGVIS